MIVKHQIDFGSGWVDCTPINWKPGVMLENIFTDEEPSSTLEGGGFTWVDTKDSNIATQLAAYEDGGVTGTTPGMYEPPKYQIFIPDSPNIYLFQGVVDMPKRIRECGKYTAPLKYISAIDWFHTNAEGITFLGLTKDGLASASIPPPSGFNAYVGPPGTGAKYEYKVVPYVITQETDVPQAITLLLEEIAMFANVKTAVANTIAVVKKILGDLGVTATFLYSPVGIIQGILDVLALVAQFAWDAILVVAIIGNIEMLISQCGLIAKYKYAMTVSDIMHAGFDFINNYVGTPSGVPLNFKSSIFDSGPYANTTIIPRKIYKENDTNIILSLLKGGVMTRGTEVGVNNTYGYPDYNLKETLHQLYGVFNAKTFIIGNQARFEEQHYFINSGYNLPNVDKPSFNANWPDPHEVNSNEMHWNYEVQFQTDTSDERTMIVYTGTTCNVCTFPKTVKHPENVLPCSGSRIVFAFALAKRKEYLNFIENVVNDILGVLAPVYNDIVTAINDVLSVIKKIAKFFGVSISVPTINTLPSGIDKRLIGVLELSNDTFDTPKIFIGTPAGNLWKIDPNNGANNNGVWVNPNVPSTTPYKGEGWMSAWALMNQFHGKNLPLFTPVDYTGKPQPQINNQWRIYKNKRFPLCAQDYANMIGNNMFLVPQPGGGKAIAKIDKLKFNVYDSMAEDVTYRVSALHSLNLKTITTIDGN